MDYQSFSLRAAFSWAFCTWRKYFWSWLFLWVSFVVIFLAYALFALIIGMLNPLLAILVYLLGCILPSCLYGAFIKIGLKEQEHQHVNKSFFRYLSLGRALDIVLSRVFVFLAFIGLSFVCMPAQYLFTRLGSTSAAPLISVLCLLIAYALFYFYPLIVVDTHGGRRIFKKSFLYAYYNFAFVVAMTLLWWIGLLITACTLGVAGFFVFPLLTLVDIYAYKSIKV